MRDENSEPHTLNHALRYRLLGTIGVDRMRVLSDALTHFGVSQAEREHIIYPVMLSWLESGIGEVRVDAAALEDGAHDMVSHYADGTGVRNVLHLFKAYVRTAAIRQLEIEEERAARGRVPVRAQFERVMGVALAQPAPPEFLDWTRTAMRLCAELRQVGRSPRELPEDVALWPSTYLPQLGPEP